MAPDGVSSERSSPENRRRWGCDFQGGSHWPLPYEFFSVSGQRREGPGAAGRQGKGLPGALAAPPGVQAAVDSGREGRGWEFSVLTARDSEGWLPCVSPNLAPGNAQLLEVSVDTFPSTSQSLSLSKLGVHAR